jgi:acyl dehydratase
MLAALGKTALRALAQKMGQKRGTNGTASAALPIEIERTAEAPSSELIAAYVKHLGGDAKAYKGKVPPHLFPHWVMPVATDGLANVPYPLTKILNAGCRLQVNAPIPLGERLIVRAALVSIEDDGRRALITLRVFTGPSAAPQALEVEIRAIVPLGGRGGDKARDSGEKPRVPLGAREIQRSRLPADAGLSFAKLTGDFNPIHWVAPAARAAGFRNVILHGYGTFARTFEALNRGLFSGDATRLKVLDARFTRPLVLPHDVGFYVNGDEAYVGDAPGGPLYMSGRFETRPFDSA